jgi:hypothetical protein
MPKARLRADEIDRYLSLVAALPLPGDQAQQLAARLRPWAESDDGKPTYMLNLNRYFAELRPFPGAPEFEARPHEAHAHYHQRFARKWLRNASYPIFNGTPQGEPLTQAQPRAGALGQRLDRAIPEPAEVPPASHVARPCRGPALQVHGTRTRPRAARRRQDHPRLWLAGRGIPADRVLGDWVGPSRSGETHR